MEPPAASFIFHAAHDFLSKSASKSFGERFQCVSWIYSVQPSRQHSWWLLVLDAISRRTTQARQHKHRHSRTSRTRTRITIRQAQTWRLRMTAALPLRPRLHRHRARRRLHRQRRRAPATMCLHLLSIRNPTLQTILSRKAKSAPTRAVITMKPLCSSRCMRRSLRRLFLNMISPNAQGRITSGLPATGVISRRDTTGFPACG